MKKKIIGSVFIMFITLMVISSSKIYATNHINVDVETENNEKTYFLEDLLKDETEQNRIKEEISKIPVEDLQKQEQIPVKSNIMGSSANNKVNEPINSKCLKGVAGDGYTWYVQDNTTGNSTDKSTNASFVIYKHDMEKNTNTQIYETAKKDNAHYITYYFNSDILYILYVKNYDFYAKWGTEYAKSNIIGIHIKTNKVVYNKEFNTPQNCTYLPSFAVDNEQRFYFVYRSTGTRIFDKNAKLLYDHKPIENSEYINFIKGVSPNSKALFFEVMYQRGEYAYFQSVYEGIQKLSNGVFVQKDAYTIYGREYPNVYSYNPRWYFLDKEGTYAADQYGRIVKFDYNVKSDMGVDRKVLLDLNSGVYDYTYYTPAFPNVCKNGNDIYIMGSNSNIYKVTQKGDKFTTTKYIKTDFGEYLSQQKAGYDDIYTMACYGNNLVISYRESWYTYIKKISLGNSSFTNITNKVISAHASTKHTKADIRKKYQQTMPKFNYNTSIYKVTPSWKAPFKEGSLKDQVVKDTLNTLNYNRWLIGTNEITVNTNKMARSQKGAVISKANNEISHTPKKPSGMTDEFYKEAYDGCYAKYEEGDTYSGNVSYGDRKPYEAIRGFINDLNNISYGSATGHRQSMLDPKATQISFGQCEEYSTASIYYNPNKKLTESYYAFPPAGYFPSQEMQIGEYWSFYIGNEKAAGTVSIRLTYHGKQYKGTGVSIESGYPVINFKLPEELRKLLGKDNSDVPSGTSIQVEILGLKDENLNNITYQYTVNFFDINTDIPITKVTLNKTSVTLEKGATYALTATIAPNNTNYNKFITWTSSNTKVATVDNNGKIIAKGVGTAVITAKTSNGKTATCKVTVTKPVFSVNYCTHVQNIGWQGYVKNGAMSGTSGKALRLEGIKIKLTNSEYSGGITYRTHVQNIGWQDWKKNDAMAGTSGKSLRLEAIQMKLTGEIAKQYDIYYRVHCQEFGWMDWAKNGESAGSAGYSYRLEAIQICLVEKGGKAPGSTANSFKSK